MGLAHQLGSAQEQVEHGCKLQLCHPCRWLRLTSDCLLLLLPHPSMQLPALLQCPHVLTQRGQAPDEAAMVERQVD